MSDDTGANPLLLEWVKEWYDTAREHNSKGVTTYRHAYDSLRTCPVTFEHPTSLQQLKGFGPKLCERLTERLRNYCKENGLPMPKHPGFGKRRHQHIPQLGDDNDDDDTGDPSSRPAKKPRKTKTYVPAYRSGPYALLLVLASQGQDGRVGMTKPDLIEAAQPHCDASFTAPGDATKFYTAWNSMKTLLQKELVYERGRPTKRYALTDEGWEVARQIRGTATAKAAGSGFQPAPAAVGSVNNVDRLDRRGGSDRHDGPLTSTQQPQPQPHPQPAFTILDDDIPPPENLSEYYNVVPDTNTGSNANNSAAALPTFTPIVLPPGSFTVRLVLDVREIRAKTDRDYMQDELAKRGAKPIMRSLELGDALWVAKCHDPGLLGRHGAEGDEVVLDWIVERKRLDDLIGSIKDGRFHEQKFRLRRSGVANVVYLVEEISMDAATFQKHEEAVRSAIAATQVVAGWFVKRTERTDDSIRYLARMTALLEQRYAGRALRVVPTTVLTAQNHLPLMAHLRAATQPELGNHYITYPAFASLASKSELMTLRDVYLKMLMCTRGLTGDRALEIQKVWKTPYELAAAFERCGSGEEGARRKANLVADRLSHLVGRKKMSKALSQKIAEVWGDVPRAAVDDV